MVAGQECYSTPSSYSTTSPTMVGPAFSSSQDSFRSARPPTLRRCGRSDSAAGRGSIHCGPTAAASAAAAAATVLQPKEAFAAGLQPQAALRALPQLLLRSLRPQRAYYGPALAS